ncbi:hypothetical protein MsAg5_07170 [Methanosarcinaceae archaeon Ag5]|uniref:PEGA domain-containing protein n=1 Tax=Methanolapillus africanus TaxID=3028297 RepID=A0AAE4SDR3_9EURY|nr:hypothetical protein [Methanosarcinaceae archaeon Ag5]
MKTIKNLFSIFVVLLVLLSLASVAIAADSVGGDKGTYVIKCNVNGANVTLIDINGNAAYNGTVQNGQATIPVYLTGTPIDKVKVEADGYTTAVVTIGDDCRPGVNGTATITVTLKQKTIPWIPIILIVLIIILIIAYAYLYYKEKKEKTLGGLN